MSDAPERQWVAIVNPGSRGARAPRDLSVLLADLRGRVGDVFVTERAGHVDALVRQCRSAAGIFVAGGDGTLFEVLQACDRPAQRLALAPFGRGNSLATDLAIRSATSAVQALSSGVDRTIDLIGVSLQFDDGRVWSGVSASNLALGYPAEVANDAVRWRSLGAASYAVAAVFARPAWFEARLCVDDAPAELVRLSGLIASNSRYVGPFLGFPHADLSDGVFHLMELRAGRLRQTVHNLSSLSGLRMYEPVILRDVRRLRVELDRPARLKIDGEIRDGVRAFDAALLPKAVTFRVPGGDRA